MGANVPFEQVSFEPVSSKGPAEGLTALLYFCKRIYFP